MTQDKGFSFTLRVVLGIAAAGVALFFMNMASEMIVQILLAWIIVLSASPLFYWMQEKNVPGWLALLLTLIAIVAVFGSLVIVLSIAVDRLAELLLTYTDEIQEFKDSMANVISGIGVSGDNANATAQLLDPSVLLNFYAEISYNGTSLERKRLPTYLKLIRISRLVCCL